MSASTATLTSTGFTLNELVLGSERAGCGLTVLMGTRHAVTSHREDDLRRGANAVAYTLQQGGLKPGERVLIVLPTGIEFVRAFLGVSLAGGIAVPCAPQNVGVRDLNAYASRLTRILDSCRPSVAILERKGQEIALLQDASRDRGMRLLPIQDVEAAAPPARFVPQQPEDLCFIQYTSGSTGTPKGVPVTHARLYHNIRSISRAVAMAPDDVVVSWLPLHHDMGLVGGLLLPLYNHVPVLLFAPELFVHRPSLWLRWMGEYRGTVSPANNFGYKYCLKRIKDSEVAGVDLSPWRLALNGSEPIDMGVAEDFQRRFEPFGYRGAAMFPCYGLAEATLGVAMVAPGQGAKALEIERPSAKEAPPRRARVVCVGSAIPDMQIRIVAPGGAALPDDEVGEIEVRGPSVMDGYYGDGPGEKAEYLHEGWLRTGDLGFRRGEELYVTGRKKDLIILRGKNYSPVEMEDAIAARLQGAVAACAVFSYYHPERQEEVLAVACEVKPRAEPAPIAIAEQVRSVVLAEFGLRVESVYETRHLPRTLNGKMARSACRSRFVVADSNPPTFRSDTDRPPAGGGLKT